MNAIKSSVMKGLRNSPRQILSSALNVGGFGNSSFMSNNIKEYRDSATRNLISEIRRSPSPFSHSPIPMHKPIPLPYRYTQKALNVKRYANNYTKKHNMHFNKTRRNRSNWLNKNMTFKPITQLA